MAKDARVSYDISRFFPEIRDPVTQRCSHSDPQDGAARLSEKGLSGENGTMQSQVDEGGALEFGMV